MFYARFHGNGYEFFSQGKLFLFSADAVHSELLDYEAADLTSLPGLFENYISKGIDTRTLELTGYSYNECDIEKIKDVLCSAHAYYWHTWKKTVIEAIGTHFNRLLLYLCYHCRTLDHDFDESWYLERIETLLSPLLGFGDTYPRDFYAAYREITGEGAYNMGIPEDDIERPIEDVPNKCPIGFEDEISTQALASNMLYFILDIEAQEFEDLNTAQRSWLWEKIFKSTINESSLGVSVKKLIWPPILFYPGDRSKEADNANEDLENFRPLYALGGVGVRRNGIPAELKDCFAKAVELAKEQPGEAINEECQIENLRQLIYLEIVEMIQAGVMLRKCKRCGKYFIVSNRKISYCNRIDKDGIQCSVVGPQQTFKKKLGEDEALKVYNRAYKTHYARRKKKQMSETEFQVWCDTARNKLSQVRNGELNIAAFQKWLRD